MDRAANLLPKILHKYGITDHAHAALLLHRTQKILEEYLPLHSKSLHPKDYRSGVLTIASDNSIACQECNVLLPHLLSLLKETPEGAKIITLHVIRSIK